MKTETKADILIHLINFIFYLVGLTLLLVLLDHLGIITIN